jgi:hypothetical protein
MLRSATDSHAASSAEVSETFYKNLSLREFNVLTFSYYDLLGYEIFGAESVLTEYK